MIEHSKLLSVHNSIKDFLQKKDYSHPYIIYCTNLDREDGVDYVIDTVMGNKSARYSIIKPIAELSQEIVKIESFPQELQFENRYLVKKMYFNYDFEKAKDETFEALSEPLQTKFPVFVILSSQTSAVEVNFDRLPFDVNQY